MLNRGLDKLELLRIVEAVANEKSIDKELVIGSMESAIQKAALTKFGNDNNIEVIIDRESGDIKIQKVLEIVEKVEDSSREITLDDAKKIKLENKDLKLGEKIYEELPQVDFGRIAAQSVSDAHFLLAWRSPMLIKAAAATKCPPVLRQLYSGTCSVHGSQQRDRRGGKRPRHCPRPLRGRRPPERARRCPSRARRPRHRLRHPGRCVRRRHRGRPARRRASARRDSRPRTDDGFQPVRGAERRLPAAYRRAVQRRRLPALDGPGARRPQLQRPGAGPPRGGDGRAQRRPRGL